MLRNLQPACHEKGSPWQGRQGSRDLAWLDLIPLTT